MIRRKPCGKRCALWSLESLVAGIACAVALIVFAVMASLIHDVLFADAVPQTVAPIQTRMNSIEQKLDVVLAQGGVR